VILFNGKPNIILLVLDSVRYDRMGFSGHAPSATPVLDNLFKNGVVATRAISPGCPTQFAFPALFTSTLPLDQGGYDRGIHHRTASFVECLREGGYATGGFVSGGWANALHGYHRGFDEFHHLFDISLFLKNFVMFEVDYFAPLLARGTIGWDYILRRLRPLLHDTFPFLEGFCKEKVEELNRGTVASSPVLHQWDFDGLLGVVAAEAEQFHKDPASYIASLFGPEKDSPLFFGVPGEKTGILKSSGEYVIDAMSRWIVRRGEGPFFAWGHLMDVHDANFVTHDLLRSPSAPQQETLRTAGIHGKTLGAAGSYRSATPYDYSLAYVDQQVANLVNFLDDRGVLKNTLIAFVADHGSRGGGMPQRATGDVISMYDELLHVPMALFHPSLPSGTVDRVCSTLDLPPTLLDLAGIPAPSSFRGRSILGDAPPEDHVLMENLGRGPCDMDLKPINIGVRTQQYKLMFRSDPGGNEAVTEFYDLLVDSGETRNVKDVAGYRQPMERLTAIARNRCRAVRAGAMEERIQGEGEGPAAASA
jgi:arylsulfatase A-like enzyme